MTYPSVKAYVKTAENEFFEYIPLSRQHAGMVGSIALTAVSGKINTNRIKKFNMNVIGGNMRPDIVYDFRTGETAGLINISWTF